MAMSSWQPDAATLARANLTHIMRERGVRDYAALHAWSVRERAAFWEFMTARLGIVFRQPPAQVVDLNAGVEQPRWFPGATMNIVESCFRADPAATAIAHQSDGGPLQRLSYGALARLTNRVANGLRTLGLRAGEAVAIDLPMTVEAVAMYLGVIKLGAVVVAIADSFAAPEIATRLRIAPTKLIFTQDVIRRGDKTLPLYDKVVAAQAPCAIVKTCRADRSPSPTTLRSGDITWEDFLGDDTECPAVACNPDAATNVLFSSGTTGDPKAIPWTHTTPIKCAADAHLHHDIHSDDVLAWPTNLGWMMGPWLIYASLINRATMALYDGAPTTRGFGEFVRDAKVTMLGLVPSLVKAWRESACMADLDWTHLHGFSSTGECSNADDYAWLMAFAGGRPVIEYCGGTEIGGGYLTCTMIQPASPATFTTPALGLDVVVLDEQGQPTNNGEMFLVPPSIGLSTTLLNADHHAVYHAEVPRGPRGEPLRRHGDQIERLPNGYFRAHGRADDTMNLGGIKTSSAAIECVVNQVEGVRESAAIAVAPPGGGPSWLVIYVVCAPSTSSATGVDVAPTASIDIVRRAMQARLKTELNPLFKIHDLVPIDQLPRTASGKVMRRALRARYALPGC